MSQSIRPKRLRSGPQVRALIRETKISSEALVYPLFLVEGQGVRREIASLPGQDHYSVDRVCEAIEESLACGVNKFLLFGIPDEKDSQGSGAWSEDGVVQKGIRAIRTRYPETLLIGDVCLCEYTDHGHCGALCGERLDNDETLKLLARTAVSQTAAGADIVAPSAMADGQVAAIRAALDKAGYGDTAIMSYSAKYASAFYGPFRDAAGSAPAFGDRKSYQMDPHNLREAVKESLLDQQEGADYLMVKPAISYLDVIQSVRAATNLPLAAYSVSGEYAMIKAASDAGLLDGHAAMCETAISIFRAGADILITYFAKEIAGAIKRGDVG